MEHAPEHGASHHPTAGELQMDRPESAEPRAAILAQFHAAEYSAIMARISA